MFLQSATISYNINKIIWIVWLRDLQNVATSSSNLPHLHSCISEKQPTASCHSKPCNGDIALGRCRHMSKYHIKKSQTDMCFPSVLCPSWKHVSARSKVFSWTWAKWERNSWTNFQSTWINALERVYQLQGLDILNWIDWATRSRRETHSTWIQIISLSKAITFACMKMYEIHIHTMYEMHMILY